MASSSLMTTARNCAAGSLRTTPPRDQWRRRKQAELWLDFSVPTHFFDVQLEGADVVKDDEGFDLPDLEAARREAVMSAREQIADAAKQGFDVTDRQFQVRDQSGEVVLILNFREVLRRRLS
jgi:hypothetical protein